MPVIVSQIDYNWYQHWESLIFIGLQDIKEVIVLEEAHGSISDLQVDTTDALDNALE